MCLWNKKSCKYYSQHRLIQPLVIQQTNLIRPFLLDNCKLPVTPYVKSNPKVDPCWIRPKIFVHFGWINRLLIVYRWSSRCGSHLAMSSGGSRIFHRWGCRPRNWVPTPNTAMFQIFACKNERIRTLGDTYSRSALPGPPMMKNIIHMKIPCIP